MTNIIKNLEALEKFYAEQDFLVDSEWRLGFNDRGMGHGDYAIITPNEYLILKVPGRILAEHIIKLHNDCLTVTSYPIYILDLADNQTMIVFPEDKKNVDHYEFWQATVYKLVGDNCGFDEDKSDELIAHHKCMKRATINSKGVVYASEEDHSDELLKQILEATGEKNLKWGIDPGLNRTDFDKKVIPYMLCDDPEKFSWS